MTDTLGQSQVIPYLLGLSKYGYQFVILSAEKKDNYIINKEVINSLLKNNNILWYPIIYTKKPPVLSTLWDILKLRVLSKKLHTKHNFQIVHCRSYITAFIGLYLKKTFGIKFIFDMRGFYADERIDGNLWNNKFFIYRIIYKYFKKKEVQFLTTADYTISLTNIGKNIIYNWKIFENFKPPIEIIPCCADLELFSTKTISNQFNNEFKIKYNVHDDDFIISYLGSIGTWYLLDEMLLFFKRLLLKKPNAKFLFITKDKPYNITNKAERFNIPVSKIIIVPAERNEIPSLLSLSKISVFFIKSVFSKKASSPTKLGEILGVGIPIICNSNVGDVDNIISSSGTGLIIDNFTDMEFDKAINNIDELLKIPKEIFFLTAQKTFSLQNGIDLYNNVYKKVLKQN